MAEVSLQRCSLKKAARRRCNTGICIACCGFPKLLSRPRKKCEMVL